MSPVTLAHILIGLAALAAVCLLLCVLVAALRCPLCERTGPHRRDCLLRDL